MMQEGPGPGEDGEDELEELQ
eukprot:COSAG06_NODE_7813_length_2365_cov_2.367608_2_plen_20_part_01